MYKKCEGKFLLATITGFSCTEKCWYVSLCQFHLTIILHFARNLGNIKCCLRGSGILTNYRMWYPKIWLYSGSMWMLEEDAGNLSN